MLQACLCATHLPSPQLVFLRPLWRVSSTLFSHVRSSAMLEPLGPYAQAPGAELFPPILAGRRVQQVLEGISLSRPTSA